MGQKIFSVILILGLVVWIISIANLTGCTPQEELADSYSCEEVCNSNVDIPY